MLRGEAVKTTQEQKRGMVNHFHRRLLLLSVAALGLLAVFGQAWMTQPDPRCIVSDPGIADSMSCEASDEFDLALTGFPNTIYGWETDNGQCEGPDRFNCSLSEPHGELRIDYAANGSESRAFIQLFK